MSGRLTRTSPAGLTSTRTSPLSIRATKIPLTTKCVECWQLFALGPLSGMTTTLSYAHTTQASRALTTPPDELLHVNWKSSLKAASATSLNGASGKQTALLTLPTASHASIATMSSGTAPSRHVWTSSWGSRTGPSHAQRTEHPSRRTPSSQTILRTRG